MAMVERIKKLKNVGEIYIIDNGSTYEPLLEWYNTHPCEVIYMANLGHTAPWINGLVTKLNTPYVVTDSDLGLENIPDDVLLVLEDKLNKYPYFKKIGIGLDWKVVPTTSPYFAHVNTYEKNRWETSDVIDGLYPNVHIDTTFALYNVNYYFIGGASLSYPYVARHYPWEFTNNDRENNAEFMYYLKTASSSCSYKSYLGV